jgi:hypothetical protein
VLPLRGGGMHGGGGGGGRGTGGCQRWRQGGRASSGSL